MLNRFSLLATMALALCVIAQGAHADKITNGNFAAGLTGWGSSGDVAAIPELAYQSCCGTANALTGVNIAGFGSGDTPDNGLLSQTFATTIGQSYAVSFEYGAIVGNNPQSLQVTVDGAGVDLLRLITTTFSTNDFSTVFSPFSYDFTADAANTTLSFADKSTITNSVDGVLTGVSVDAVRSVPEAFTLSILGAGLLGAAAVRRRKAKSI